MGIFKNFLLLFWIVSISAASLIIGAWHSSDFSVSKVYSGKKLKEQKRWQLVHFLGGECQCSEYIVDYLIKRGPSKYYEKIVIFDDEKNFTPRLRGAGFLVESFSYEKIATEEKPDGIPVLLIASPEGEVKYEGGYSDRMLNPFSKIQDLKQVSRVMKEPRRKVASLPAYGCYMSKKYRKWLDPLGLKYENER